MSMIEVVQVVPQINYDLYVYFDDGKIVRYNISQLVGKGVFKALENLDFYMNRCTVMNHAVAWDLSGRYDPRNCVDLAPEVVYEDGISVRDPLQRTA